MGGDITPIKWLSIHWVAHWSLESISSVDNSFLLDDGSTFLNPLCTWTLTGALGMEKSSCVNLESVEKKYNLNWKIFSLLSKNSNIYFAMQWWKLLWFLSKKKIVPSSGSFLTTLDIFSFPSLIFSFSSLMKKKKINFKVDKINFYKWEIHIKEENSSYNIIVSM